MKIPMLLTCALVVISTHGAHAQIADPVPAEVAAFLGNPTHCAVLIGGVDRVGDGADRVYSESLNKALTVLGGPLRSATEWMRSACASQLAQLDRPVEEAP